MNSTWQEIWNAHPDVFIIRDWQECSAEKVKTWRLPSKFSYFMGGETSLRVGIIASPTVFREEEFLLAGVLLGNRLSNGAKTVLYFVAPNFSPFFLQAISKIGGNLSARAVYWREKLNPSLYLIPDSSFSERLTRYSLGEEKPDWKRWGQGLNPVARQQLDIVKEYFDGLVNRKVREELKPQMITFYWGSFEIAEIYRKGKKFELECRIKWEKNAEKALQWRKAGWVDASGSLNSDFCTTLLNILEHLENMEKDRKMRPNDLLRVWLHHGGGILTSLWGNPWHWPWLPKERSESCVTELNQWFYFQCNGQISVVCPILEKPLSEASHSIILASVLEKSYLLTRAKGNGGEYLQWDGRVHWLTISNWEEDLRKWHCWLKIPEQFPIWVLPENWQEQGLNEITCRNTRSDVSAMRSVP